MAKKVEYHPEARLEMQESAVWYDRQVDGLGLEFLLEIKRVESLITRNPATWPEYESGTRRYVMKRFPYAVIYLTSEESIQVVAVAHCRRKPGYWKDRVKGSGTLDIW